MNDVQQVLFTGFETFADHAWNPSGEVAASAAAAFGVGAESRVLPVTVETARKFPSTLKNQRMVVCVGLSRRKRVEVELMAKNVANDVPDNAGVAGPFTLEAQGPDVCVSRLAPALARQLKLEVGDGVGTSEDAGGYVCNALYYACLRAADAGAPPAVFVHVPAFSTEAAASFGERLGNAVRALLADANAPDCVASDRVASPAAGKSAADTRA